MKFYLLTDETKKGRELAPFVTMTYFNDYSVAEKKLWELLLEYRRDVFTHQNSVQFDVYEYSEGFTIMMQSEDNGEYAYARLKLTILETATLINGRNLLDIEGY